MQGASSPGYLLTVLAFINEPFFSSSIEKIVFRDVSQSQYQVIIIGSGPAGLFAALNSLNMV